MTMQSILVALTVVGTSAAFAQEKMSPEPAGPVAEAAIQLSSEEEERLLIQKLEQIENDPFVREKAKAEAEVPLSVF